MFSKRLLPELIREICRESSWHVECLSNDWILEITHDQFPGKKLHIFGYQWDLNPAAVQMIAADKVATSQILSLHGVSHSEHALLLNPSYDQKWLPNEGVQSYCDNLLKKASFPLVIKPKNGSLGTHVSLVQNVDEARGAIYDLFALNRDVALSPYIQSEFEYRCIVLDNEILLTYRKILPSIIGDGVRTVRELLEVHNEALLLKYLDQNTLQTIVAVGEHKVLSWKHNLSKGAKAEFVGEPDPAMIDLVKKAVRAIGMVFCSVDVLFDEMANSWKVLEINSGVTINKCIPALPRGREDAKEIFRKAIEWYFNH
ncbi:hypothetical protein H6776_01690 [Candidatus Nomurabacteria bacterium]|nr:hypothetical protein [Candidatus Nomurabacteria bacterium]